MIDLYHLIDVLISYLRQGEATTTQRQFSERVHIDDVGSLMNALGFYPTKRDMDHMINEIKYGNAASSSEITTEISINDVIRCTYNLLTYLTCVLICVLQCL